MSRRLLPRLLPASVVAILTALAFGAALGAANAAGADDAGLESLEVASPRLGDRGGYDATLTGDWKPGPYEIGKPFRVIDFEWRAGEIVRDGDGYLVPTDAVATHGLDYMPFLFDIDMDLDGEADEVAWFEHNDTELFLQGTSRLVATKGIRSESEQEHTDGPVPMLPDVLAQDWLQRMNNSWTMFGNEEVGGPCLLSNPLQGTTIEAATKVDLTWNCSMHGLLYLQPMTLDVVGPETVNGIATMHLSANSATKDLYMPSAVDLWLAPGIAYPLRVQVTVEGGTHHVFTDSGAEEIESGPRTVVLDLAAFEPGNAPRTSGPAPADPVPDLEMAPRTPWALDDTGANLPFPLSTAYTKARDEPTYSDFREYLDAHPKAVVSNAFLMPGWNDGTSTRHEWFIILQDRSSMFILFVMKSLPNAAAGLPAPLPETLSHYSYSAYPIDAPGDLDVDNAPEELPTVRSLMERWTYYASPDMVKLGGNSLLYASYCTGKDCDTQEAFLGAGHLDFTGEQTIDPAGPAFFQGVSMKGSQVMVRPGHGAAAMMYEYDASVEGSTGIVANAGGEDSISTLGSATTRPVGSFLPSPEQAAGAGLLAVLTGALYWLWPVLKSGSFLGFSRLRTSRLLEHPQRARIADLVAAEPGIHFQELARRTGMPNGTLVHHVQKLVAGELLVAHRSGRYTCYFPKASPIASRAGVGVTKSDGAKAVLAAIHAHPGLTMQDVALQCGLQASTVTYHVQRLAEAGLVSVARDGRFQRLQASGVKAA